MTGNFIIESFWQKKSNCTSIVLIKAAILKYGVNGIFKKENRSDHYVFTLKDKKIIAISKADMAEINTKNAIVFSKFRDPRKKRDLQKLRECVQMCFALMVRNMQLHGYDGKEYTQSAAIKQLTHAGMKTEHLTSILGLKRATKSSHTLMPGHLRLFKRKKAVLLFSDVHIVVASMGVYENYGNVLPITDKVPLLKGKKAKYWFELK